MSELVRIDDLDFALRRSSRRATVGITLDRDGSLLISAPDACSSTDIERAVRSKLPWLYRKLAEQTELCSVRRSPKEFTSGESFSYLGRTYRLQLIETQDSDFASPAVRLHHGRFILARNERSRAHSHFVHWYVAHGHQWLSQRLPLYVDRVGIEPRLIQVRDLGYRWGSCETDGVLRFHWRTICAPPRIIDYVIVHELIHLIEPNHGAQFWQRLERILPDYQERKRWLAVHGGWW